MKKILVTLFACAATLTTFAQTRKHDAVRIIVDKTSSEYARFNRPLVFLDGKKFSADSLAFIDPKTIDSIQVVQKLEAIATYGDEGKNGALIIKSKEFIRNREE